MKYIALALLFAVAACGGESRTPDAPPVAHLRAPAHAPANARPGSYEDWCAEHEVPESLCARCNPSLVAAFQATGDWCTEHEMPESQCKACNPGLTITRPPRQ